MQYIYINIYMYIQKSTVHKHIHICHIDSGICLYEMNCEVVVVVVAVVSNVFLLFNIVVTVDVLVAKY